jgi:hypothetical protein
MIPYEFIIVIIFIVIMLIIILILILICMVQDLSGTSLLTLLLLYY